MNGNIYAYHNGIMYEMSLRKDETFGSSSTEDSISRQINVDLQGVRLQDALFMDDGEVKLLINNAGTLSLTSINSIPASSTAVEVVGRVGDDRLLFRTQGSADVMIVTIDPATGDQTSSPTVAFSLPAADYVFRHGIVDQDDSTHAISELVFTKGTDIQTVDFDNTNGAFELFATDSHELTFTYTADDAAGTVT